MVSSHASDHRIAHRISSCGGRGEGGGEQPAKGEGWRRGKEGEGVSSRKNERYW